jgi:hypothetical protein
MSHLEPPTATRPPLHPPHIADPCSPMEASNTPARGSATHPGYAAPPTNSAGMLRMDSPLDAASLSNRVWDLSADRSCLADTCCKPDDRHGQPGDQLCGVSGLQTGVFMSETDEWSGDAQLLQMVDDMELDHACLVALEHCSKDTAD